MNGIMQLITGRRSIRRYTSRDVPEEMLHDVLAAAQWAPSWANTQCWEIVVVRDPGIKEQLQGVLSPRNPAGPAFAAAPVVLAVCGKNKVSGYYKGRRVTALGDWKLYDLGLATQNMLLAAASHKLGTVVVGAFDHRRAGEILGVPDGVEVVTLIPLGFPDQSPGAPRRKELADFVHQDRY